MLRPARAAYRTRQVFNALNPRIDADDLALARAQLSPAEQRLFEAMHRRDQRHALEVACRLRTAGVDDADLLKAALLHDCGKGEVPVWLRVLKVLNSGFVRGAGDESSTGWRAAAYRLTYHPEIGARLAQQAGAPPATVAFICGRVDPADKRRLAQLAAADDAS